MNYDTLLQKLREQRLVLDTLTREQRRTREQVTAALGRIKQHDLQSIEDTVEHILYTVLWDLDRRNRATIMAELVTHAEELRKEYIS